MKRMRKTLLCLSLCLICTANYGQTKEQAINDLRQTFASYFVKTAVYLIEGTDKTARYYDYEITPEYILIRKSIGSPSSESYYWTCLPYITIDGLAPGNNKSIFKKQTVLQFQPPYGNKFDVNEGKAFVAGKSYTTSLNVPFNNIDDNSIFSSIATNIKIIADANVEEIKIAKQHSMDEKESNDVIAILTENATMKAISLQPYSVFTSDSIMVNLYEHVERSRKFKEKPTLLVFYSNEWCKPCLRSIDTLLKCITTPTYNIVLINIDHSSGLTKLNKKILDHSPDYHTSSILLFDRTNQTNAIYSNSAPMFLWFDKKLNIRGTYKGYDLTSTTFNAVFHKIE